jgi:hypothetical protein
MDRYEKLWEEMYNWLRDCAIKQSKGDENKAFNEVLDKMDELENLYKY